MITDLHKPVTLTFNSFAFHWTQNYVSENTTLIHPVNFSPNFSQQDEITIVSWNIQDFGKTKSNDELEQIAEVVRDVDIVVIQEVVSGYGGAQAVAI